MAPEADKRFALLALSLLPERSQVSDADFRPKKCDLQSGFFVVQV